MTKKTNKTIAANALTDYLYAESQTSKKSTLATGKTEKKEETPGTLKQRVTIHMSVELIDRVKNAVYWEPGLTLTEFAERAFDRELKKWEKEWGEAYPQRRDYQLKGGRPLK
jgi:hypothetical protein